MGSSVTIPLPWPPTVNTYFRSILIGGAPRVLISKRGRDYRLDVQQQILERFGVRRPLRDRLSVSIDAHPPDRRSRDLDNLFKGLLDSLTHARVWEDDSLIDELSIRRRSIKSGGLVLVRIELIEAEPVASEQRLLDLTTENSDAAF
jgi:crossover junction endodeoxyribonuclease RusA